MCRNKLPVSTKWEQTTSNKKKGMEKSKEINEKEKLAEYKKEENDFVFYMCVIRRGEVNSVCIFFRKLFLKRLMKTELSVWEINIR